MSDAPAPPADPDFADRWSTLLGILSLDLTRGHMAAMGLHVPDEAAFQEELRALVVAWRAREDGAARTVEDFFEAVFGWVRRTYGPALEAYLRAWGDTVARYDPPKGAQVFYWRNIVLRGGIEGGRDVGPTPAFVTLLRSELRKRPLEADIPNVPESAWDIEYFVRHGYDPRAGGDDVNPMDLVENTIRHAWFLEGWEAAVARSVALDADLEELWAWGLDEAARLNIPASILQRPGSWSPLPRPPADAGAVREG